MQIQRELVKQGELRVYEVGAKAFAVPLQRGSDKRVSFINVESAVIQ